MALTLRDEFGDLVKWKVILIVELVLLVVFGSMVFPGLVGDAFKEKPGDDYVPPAPPNTDTNETEGSIFEGKILKGVTDCGGGMFCTMMQEETTGVVYVIRYNRVFGHVYEGHLVSVYGTIEGELINVRGIVSKGFDIPLGVMEAE